MNWQILAASVVGSSHLRTQLPCQDAHAVRVLTHGVLLCVVADGLGSAGLAQAGAQLAVQVALDSLTAALQSGLLGAEVNHQSMTEQAFVAARTALEEKAAQENRPLHDYATTLLVAIVADGWLSVAHLGDGAVVAQFANEALCTFSTPQRGEYANETMPLTSSNALTAVRYQARAGEVLGLALFTDGLQNLCLDAASNEPYEPFFAPLFAQLAAPIDSDEASRALLDFLQSERVNKRSDDDKTLVLVHSL